MHHIRNCNLQKSFVLQKFRSICPLPKSTTAVLCPKIIPTIATRCEIQKLFRQHAPYIPLALAFTPMRNEDLPRHHPGIQMFRQRARGNSPSARRLQTGVCSRRAPSLRYLPAALGNVFYTSSSLHQRFCVNQSHLQPSRYVHSA